MRGVYFISGIDTDIGKSYATGFLAKQLSDAGKKVITQKPIQTGNNQISEDILLHRKLMQVPMFPEDKLHLTMPVLLNYPASPHLASRLDNVPIDLKAIARATEILSNSYEIVLLEGAGGLMVPLLQGDCDYLIVDYIQEHNFPVILVTSGKLGSINHTLLSLELLKQRGLVLYALVYNECHDGADLIVSQDTKKYFQEHLAKHFPKAKWITMPFISSDS